MFKRIFTAVALVLGSAVNSFAVLSADVQAVVDAADIGGLSSATSTLLVAAMGIVLIFVAYALATKGLHRTARG